VSQVIYLTQLRARLEQSFAPLACDCALTGDNSLTVKLYHPVSGQVDLVVSGLNIANLRTPETLRALIEELRYELQTNALHRPETS
jgi:hypothetical protein